MWIKYLFVYNNYYIINIITIKYILRRTESLSKLNLKLTIKVSIKHNIATILYYCRKRGKNIKYIFIKQLKYILVFGVWDNVPLTPPHFSCSFLRNKLNILF